MTEWSPVATLETLTLLARTWLAGKAIAHWERGYRVHGLWVGNSRIARVGIPPGRRATEYRWGIDIRPFTEGVSKTLQQGRAAAEDALKRALRD